MCGEQQAKSHLTYSVEGSSPRVRGAVPFIHEKTKHSGIIPACAGSSNIFNSIAFHIWDHPRVCGEQFSTLAAKAGGAGSSPRVRGAVFQLSQFAGYVGIIPACAGSSVLDGHVVTPKRDHPRVCGEQFSLRAFTSSEPGSSPRVRGAEHSRRGLLHGRGIIPACAGSSGLLVLDFDVSEDHPRVCGEQQNLLDAQYAS